MRPRHRKYIALLTVAHARFSFILRTLARLAVARAIPTSTGSDFISTTSRRLNGDVGPGSNRDTDVRLRVGRH